MISLTTFAAFWPVKPIFLNQSRVLPQACFSEGDKQRGYCFGYMQASVDYYFSRELDNLQDECDVDEFNEGQCLGYSVAMKDFLSYGFPEIDVACFLGEIFALRNVSLRGWNEINKTLQWSQTDTGRLRIESGGANLTQQNFEDFVEKALIAREVISERQAGGRLPAMCAASLRVQSLWQ